jgi:hypothetical protein
VHFTAPIRAGDVVEATGSVTRVGNRSRTIEFSCAVVCFTGSRGVAMAITAPSNPATMATIRAVRWLLPIPAEVTGLDGNCPACGGASLVISRPAS